MQNVTAPYLNGGLERLSEEFGMSVTQIKDIIRRYIPLVRDRLSL